jgi:DNA-binding GntR family transcriptional regulator
MAKRWSPKINGAITYLRSSIKQHIAHNEYRLPSLEALARDAGVSVVTMHKALMVLKTEYAIESLPRKGIRIKPETNREDARTAEETRSSTDERMITPETYEFVPKYHHVKDWILADILKGEFAPTNELPKKKELVWRYNASYATITKALQCLVQEKRIYLSKKKYKTFLYFFLER